MTEKCGHCGGYHEATCPRIKAIYYYPDGTVRRVEYLEPKPLAEQHNHWAKPLDVDFSKPR